MKNNGIKNLKVLRASLCLGAVLLAGCGSNRLAGTGIIYDTESGQVTGSLSYEKVSKNLKIVTLEENGNQFKELMYVNDYYVSMRYSSSYYQTDFIRFKDGWEMEFYRYNNKEEQENRKPTSSSKLFTIVEEEPFIEYLVEYAERKPEYSAEEILGAYHEMVSLDEKENQEEAKTYEQKN